MSNPSTSLAVTQPNTERRSLLMTMGARYGVEPAKLLQTLKATAFKNSTDDEMVALLVVANQYGLNPFVKQIYAFPAKGGGITPVVGVDGWIHMMNSHPQFDGIEFEEIIEDGKPVKTTAIIYRKDRTRPVKATEYFSECYRQTEPWNTKPVRMLRWKALIQASRIAFGFSGVVDEDEADIIDVTPERAPAPLALPQGKPEPIPAAEAPPTPMRQRAKTQAEKLNTAPKEPATEKCPKCGGSTSNGECPNCDGLGENPNADPFAATTSEPQTPVPLPNLTTLERLADFCTAEGIGFAVLRKWAFDQGHIARDVLPDKWEDVPEAKAAQWLRNPVGLLTQLKLKKKEMGA